ncbi:MAG: signal peptidase I [Chloroflexi bacterium]|nr:signal peptidase I [Chloroflexota bacterium]
MAASGYDDADTPLVAETYTDALPAAAPGPEPGAEAAPRVPSESWISEEDRDWGPSPKTDPAGLWASASDDNVVLRAFEAHASTEIDEDLPSADGDGVPDFSRPSFRSLLGDDADELVEDDEILTDDHPSLSRLQGWAPQREVASVANADPAWALGANRPPSDPSRPDPDPFAEGEGAPTPPWEGDQAAAGEHGARKASRSKTLVRELVETGLLALLVFLSVRASFQNFKVDGISMQPTLEDGQFLIVNKLVYSEVDLDKLSSFVPFVNPGSDPERNVFHAPERGDIIVLRDPHKPDVDLIKRVIGLPGETVEIRDGHVYINDQLLIEPYIKTAWSDNKPKVTIPADEYYVLGDNRGNSLDSRSQQVGLIRKDLIIGKAMLSYWPRNKFGLAPNGSPSLEEKPTLSTQRIDD